MVVPERDVAVNRKERAQWLLHRLVPGRGICNIGFTIAVDRPLRWWPLQESLNHLLRRHPALRAVLAAQGAELRKRYLPADTAVPLDVLTGTEDGLAELIAGLVAMPFDVAAGPLIRARLLVLPARQVVCVVLHHLVSDAMSASLLLRELTDLYDGFAGDGAAPDALAGPGGLFLEPDPDPEAVRYWTDRLRTVDPRAQGLAFARPAPARPTFAGGDVEHELGSGARHAVARLRELTRTTDNIVLLAAYYALLARHGAGPLLVVGVPVNARRGGVDLSVVGCHTNTLPICVPVDAGAGFTDLVRATRDAFLTGLESGTASFEAIRPALDMRSDDWRLPLFRHMFNHVPRALPGLGMAGRPVDASDVHNGMSRVDLELQVFSQPDGLLLNATFSVEAYRREEVAALLARYDALLVALAAEPDRPIGTLDMRSAADRRLVEATNATAREPRPDGLLAGILAAARADPDVPAVDSWTYVQLIEVAGRVRAALGDRRGEVVGLHAGRGPELAAAVLGTWLAGAAYLPMDPAHPARRNAYQLDDAGVRAVLADRPLPPECAAGRVVIPLSALPVLPSTVDLPVAGPDDLAYVIYTSGSTGRPKGVEVSHGSLANVVRHFVEALGVTAADRVLWLTTFSFDISALELLLPLVAGARAVTAPHEARLDPAALLKFVVAEDVTVLQGTPTTWRQVAPLLDGQLRGRRVLCGGEPATAPLVDRLLADGCRIVNVYGPTETTIWSTSAELTGSDGERVSIGRPIANTGVHVLDGAGRPVPPGLPGELWITGAGLARGYRGDPAATARRFVADPALGRRYSTGDVVCQRPDGRLEFLGREDRQVKIRGYRVELAEVEALLERHPAVGAAAVFTELDPDGQPRLAAAVSPVDVRPAELRDYLADRLPEGALPGRLVPMAALPLTGNGKIDYPATAALVADRPAPVQEEPRTPEVAALVALWRQVLADPGLGPTADFFLNGGHSLLAFQLAERISAELARPVTFEMIFGAPTPVRLAEALR